MSELTSLDKNFTEKRVDNETIFIQVLNNEIVMSIVGEFNKQRKMIDKLAIQVAKHTVEITERDVVIDTLRSMITPQQEQQAFKSEEE